MPELPVVEATRKAIEDHCIGRKIKRSMIADDTIVIDGVSRSDFEASLLGKTIVAARRKGKNMWLELDSPPFPSFQFGMAGAIYIKGVVTRYKRASVKDTDEWPSKYSKFFVELDDGVELSFTDKRRLARVRLLENPAVVPPISKLGPDALLELMTIDELIDSLKKKRIGMKALLLDQSFISGIGNWIADEVLYQARIHPLQISSSLPKESCVALHTSIREVVQFAVEVDSDCSQFPPSWLYHVRWGKKAGRIDGKEIEFTVAGGRTTAFVPALQKLYGSQTAKASVKPKKETAKKSKGKDHDDYQKDNDEASESGSENARATLKGGRSRSGNTQVAEKIKVTGNSKVHTSDADKETGLKRKSSRAEAPPYPRKFSEGDKDGGENCSVMSLQRKIRNVSAKSKRGFGTTRPSPHPSLVSHSFASSFHRFALTPRRSSREVAPRCRLVLCDHHLKPRLFLPSGGSTTHALKNVATFSGRMKIVGVTAKVLWNRSMPLSVSAFPALKTNSFISGIGNWIADEVLYQAKIHPLQTSSSLPEESCVALHTSIKEVVRFAVEVDSDCSRFPPSWLYHVRWGKKAARIDGNEIEFIVAGGRTTAFVPALQKLYGSQTAKASMKPRKETAKKSKGNYTDENDNDDSTASESGAVNTQVGVKIKVRANSKYDKEICQKRKPIRARAPPAPRKFSEGDKDGGISPLRKTRNVFTEFKPGKSNKDNDGINSIYSNECEED